MRALGLVYNSSFPLGHFRPPKSIEETIRKRAGKTATLKVVLADVGYTPVPRWPGMGRNIR